MHRLGVFLHWAIPSHSHTSLILTVDDFTANSGYHLYSSKGGVGLFSTKTSFYGAIYIEDLSLCHTSPSCYLWFLWPPATTDLRSVTLSHFGSGIIYSSQHYTSHSEAIGSSLLIRFTHSLYSFINNDNWFPNTSLSNLLLAASSLFSWPFAGLTNTFLFPGFPLLE